MSDRSSQSSRFVAIGLAAAPIAAAMLLGPLATTPNIPTWYAHLTKPGFTPPDWVFAPVWTTLYVLMGVAFWRILRLPRATSGRDLALAAFLVQLALNIAWSWMFFAAHSPLLGLINIVPQWFAVLAAIVAFARIDRLAAGLLAPLAAWVGFASVLNFAVWRLNA